MKLKKTDYLLFVIIIVGTILRFYDIFSLHFINDELSALNRTRFDSFNDLINKGVMPDGHPALIQIFLYYYTKLFGYNDFITKLPFLLMGILSIFFSYKISKRFFTETSGLITASFMAVLQYTVMYSQIARPYSSGLFFILISVYFLQDYIFNDKLKKTSIIGFIIASSLSSYNHYFSLLTILLIGILGIFIVKKEHLKTYILSGLAIILLFVPHIQISLHQLSLGGLSWLSKPNGETIIMYFGYIFNYCWLFFFLINILLIVGFIFNNGFKTIKYSLFSILIFIIPIIFGYIYSIEVSPILQFSVLIFSFPFLLMFISSFIKELNFKLNIVLVGSILIIGILSLTMFRKHYTTTYKSSFYNIAKYLTNDINKYGNENISEVFILNGNFYINKYLNEFNIDTNNLDANYQTGEFNMPKFKEFINSSSTNYFAFGNTGGVNNYYLLDIIKEKYPFIINITDSYFLFSKSKGEIFNNTNVSDTIYYNEIDFNNKNNNWNFDVNKTLYDSINAEKYYLYNSDEWGISIELNLDSVLTNNNNLIILKANVQSIIDNSNILLVSEVKSPDSLLNWSSMKTDYFTTDTKNRTTIYNTVLLQDIKLENNCTAKFYLWNKDKQIIKVYNFEIIILRGLRNPYGRLMPIN